MTARLNPENWVEIDERFPVSENLIIATCHVTIPRVGKRRLAKHLATSSHWKLISGEGYVIYETPKDVVESKQEERGYILYYLRPGEVFFALADHYFMFMPKSDMIFEVECSIDQLSGDDLQYADEIPEIVKVFFRGEIQIIEDTHFVIEYEGFHAEIKISDPQVYLEHAAGDLFSHREIVNLVSFLRHLQKTRSSPVVLENTWQPMTVEEVKESQKAKLEGRKVRKLFKDDESVSIADIRKVVNRLRGY